MRIAWMLMGLNSRLALYVLSHPALYRLPQLCVVTKSHEPPSSLASVLRLGGCMESSQLLYKVLFGFDTILVARAYRDFTRASVNISGKPEGHGSFPRFEYDRPE